MRSVFVRHFLAEKRFILVIFGGNQSEIRSESGKDPFSILCCVKMQDRFSWGSKFVVSIVSYLLVEPDLPILWSGCEPAVSSRTDGCELGISTVLFCVSNSIFYSGIDFIYGIGADSFESFWVTSFSQFEFRWDLDNSFLFWTRFLNKIISTYSWISFDFSKSW